MIVVQDGSEGGWNAKESGFLDLEALTERVTKIEKRKICYCLDARYNGESCGKYGDYTDFKGDGLTPDRIRIYFCE
jgi:hypothetical protein